jgi:hypothetical protein
LETLSGILNWLAAVIAAMAVLCWCAAWPFSFVWVLALIPIDGMAQRALLSMGALAGLALSLVLLKKIVGAKRL